MTPTKTTTPARTRSTAPIMGAAALTVLCAMVQGSHAMAHAEASVPAVAQEQDPLSVALDDYGRFLNQVIEDQRPMAVVEHLDWIDRIEIAALQSTDQKLRHRAYVVLMSLANGLEDWVTAEEFCLAALDDAPDQAAEFERLGDLYAIRAMLGDQNANQRQARPEGPDALGGIIEHWKGFIDRGELDVLSAESIAIAQWALRNETEAARRSGLGDRETAARAVRSLRFTGSLESARPELVIPDTVRYERSIAAASYIETGELLNAQGVYSLCASVPVNAQEISSTYNLLHDASYVDRARFVRLMNVPAFTDPAAMDVLNKLARDAIDAHTKLKTSPAGPKAFGHQQTLDEIAYAFVELERLVSLRLTQPQARGKDRDSLREEVNRMRYALRRLTTYLRNTGEDDIADSYARILSTQYGDGTFLRD